jgi:membrane-associated phospholipid phosphatase
VDRAILLWIHQHATPTLDALFRFSNELGTMPFCVALVLAAIVWHSIRGERRERAVWVVVGLLTLLLTEIIKLVVGRQRPTLWPWLVSVSGLSFPSGHAVASATFYPLLSWLVLRSRPRWRRISYAIGLIPAAYIGLGRLYLGVHWPTDVFAGWTLGVAQSAVAVWWLGTRARHDAA